MDLRLSSCTVLVHDLCQALAFYRDVLGFDVHGGADSAGRGVSVGPPSQLGVRIVLELPASDPGLSPADKRAVEDLMARGLLGRDLVFATDDCDRTFGCLEAAGAEVTQEPIDRSSGLRDCAFLDPSGNVLRFAQHVGGSSGHVAGDEPFRMRLQVRLIARCLSRHAGPQGRGR